LGKYKYDTWRILPVKCYIDNSVRLWSCIRNVNKHFWCRCRGGSQYLLSVHGLHGIILTSIISLTDLSATWRWLLASRFAAAKFAWWELDGVPIRCQVSSPVPTGRGHCRPPDVCCGGGSPSDGCKKIIRELEWEKKRMTRYSIDIYLLTHILHASCNKDKSQNTFSLR
jgi:hypothetical protein